MVKVALVTGGMRGIGRAIVDVLQKRGDKVFVFDCIDHDHSDAVALKEQEVGYYQVDLSSSVSIKNGFSALFHDLDKMGLALTHLVNNAGITKDSLAVRLREEDWDKVLTVNLKGSFLCSQYALKRMMRSAKGYIINIASIVGKTGNIGQSNYAASKAGVIALTKTLAQEYASKNILVNAVAPGFIETSMTACLPHEVKEKALAAIPLKRFGNPYDVAAVVDFLSSGKADYITGQVIEVTGGIQG